LSQNAGGAGNLNAEDKAALFQQFLEWQKAQHAPKQTIGNKTN
jgi:hypothetical protein